MDQNEFSFIRIDELNLKDLIYLQTTVNPKPISFEYLQKKFDTHFTGKSYIGFIAYHISGEPAAYYGVYPCLMTNGERSFVACQSGDTMTNPKFQKRGLFIRLAELTYELANNEQISVVYGFPNENSSYGFFNKLNWTKLGELSRFEYRYTNTNVYNILNKYKITRFIYSFYFIVIYQFVKTKEFQNSCISPESYSVFRDDNYHLYKKYEKSYFIELKGFKIWMKFGDGILIGDVERFDINRKDHFIKTLKELAFLFGVKKINILCMEDSFLHNVLQINKKSEKSLEIGMLTLDNEYSDAVFRFSFGDADTF